MWFYAFSAFVLAVSTGVQVAAGNHYAAMSGFFALGVAVSLCFAEWVNTRTFRKFDAILDDLEKRNGEPASEDEP